MSTVQLSNDDLANLHKLAYDLPNYVWLIQTFPDMIVVADCENLLDKLNILLQTCHTHTCTHTHTHTPVDGTSMNEECEAVKTTL